MTAPAMARPLDGRAVAVGVALLVSLTVLGVVGGYAGDRRDVDEAMHLETLAGMRDGVGYYDAMSEALLDKQGVPASSIATVRPPAPFLVWQFLPSGSERWAGGLALVVAGLLAMALVRDDGGWAPAIVGGLCGMWGLSCAPHLYLHSEVWAAPFFLGALLASRNRRHELAAGLAGVAAVVREFYVILVLAGLWRAWRRREGRLGWTASTVVVTLAHAGHVVWSARIVSASGEHPSYGVSSISEALFMVSPGDSLLAWALGIGTLIFGLAGLIAAWRSDDPAARLAAPLIVPMIVLTVWSGRAYWAATWAMALIAFVPPGMAAARSWAGRGGDPDLVSPPPG